MGKVSPLRGLGLPLRYPAGVVVIVVHRQIVGRPAQRRAQLLGRQISDQADGGIAGVDHHLLRRPRLTQMAKDQPLENAPRRDAT